MRRLYGGLVVELLVNDFEGVGGEVEEVDAGGELGEREGGVVGVREDEAASYVVEGECAGVVVYEE